MLDVTVSRGEQVRIGDLAPLAFAGQSQVQSEAYLKSIHDKMVRELLFAPQLSPSCGCYLTAAFRTIKIYCTDPTNCEGANFRDKG